MLKLVFPAQYLVNQLMDFDHTCTEGLLGGGSELIRFWYPGSQAPFWGEEVTSPAIVGLNTFLVRLCHPIEGLGGLLTKYFWRDG